jgi:hypothetical protein
MDDVVPAPEITEITMRRSPTALTAHTALTTGFAAAAAAGVLALFGAQAAAAPAPVAPAAARAVTACDRMAAHPEDQQRVAPGVERAQIDLPAATRACEQAVAADPVDARQRYQLARLLFYASENTRAVDEMRRSADGGYAQAQFVFGTFVVRNRPGAPTDICVAEKYWRGAADGGRQAARVQYLRYALKGRFDGCSGVLADPQLRNLLDTASREAKDFYERLLVEDLTEALAARSRSTR